MSIVKPVEFTIEQSQVDGAGANLQKLDVTHRVAIMSALSGRVPETPSSFGAPTGVGTYYGFGSDGLYYEGGVQQKTWAAKESIDDFADKVTDALRWDGTISTDFAEGGIDYTTDTPFGKRLFAEYTGPAGVEVFDRKGKMSLTPAAADYTLSTRLNTPLEGSALGANLDNFSGIGIQVSADDTTYVFAGYINTVANPFSIVMGEYDGGVLTIGSVVALAAGTTSVDVAIEVDPVGATYRGHYSLGLTGEDFDGASWSPIGAAVAEPAAWGGTVVPRIHASFPSGIAVGTRYSIADIRVEKGSASWAGDMKASWALEDSDATVPIDISGSSAACPEKLMVVWERDNANANHLTLIDVDDTTDPLLWRRWENLPVYVPEPYAETEGVPYWSPGWMDADEGHIVMTRNTMGTGVGDEIGEVWVLSLRWDTIVVFGTTGMFHYPIFNDGTTNILRETGSWGSRQWYTPATNKPQAFGNYDHSRQPTTAFVGTLAHNSSEAAVPAITYGVHIRRCDDDKVYIAYGIQQVPTVHPATSPCYAGVILLDEGVPRPYDRYLFSKSSSSDTPWTGTDECWVGAVLSSAKVLWWTQAIDIGATTELTGVICRRDWSGDSAANLTTGAYAEVFDQRGMDRVGASAINMTIADSSPVGDEVILLAGGWAGDSWLTAVWYDGSTPADTVNKTYGYNASSRTIIPVTGDMSILAPSDKFPEWVLHQTETADASLDLCRITNAIHRTRATPTGPIEPVWAGYAEWKGIETASYRHAISRGNIIARGDFTLHMSGLFSPPFSSGHRGNAANYLKDDQSLLLRLYVMGERRLYGSIDFYLEGIGGGGSPTLEARAAFEYQNGGGIEVSVSAVYPLGSWGLYPDAHLKLRIKRQGQIVSFYIYDNFSSNYELVLTNNNMLRGALMCGMEIQMSDAVDGIAAGAMIEIDSFKLAPIDDPVGAVMTRPSDYPIVNSVGSSIAGGGLNQSSVPTSAAGNLAISEGWIFPGWMPFH